MPPASRAGFACDREAPVVLVEPWSLRPSSFRCQVISRCFWTTITIYSPQESRHKLMSASNLGINYDTRMNTFRPQYDPASQLTTLQLGYDATRKMGYDNRGYLTTMIDSGSSGAVSTIVDTYDSAGRKTKQVRDGVTSTYTMDNDDRLTLENRGGNLSSFAYDQDRNLTVLHNHGQNAVTMSHNALGQVVTSIAGSVVTTNTWDNAGRKTLANAGGTLTTFGWDQENRMVSRARNAEYDAFVYDEANHLRYRHDPTSETPDSLSYNYLDDNTFTVYSGQFGTRSEQMTPLEGVNVGNDDLDFLLDPLGSVIGKTSSSGVEDLAQFFPYGGPYAGARPVSDLWAFVGSLGYRRFDDTLYDVWNRWLETDTGHWKSLDPLWPHQLAYVYVDGMPVIGTDAAGMQLKVHDCPQKMRVRIETLCSKVLKSPKSDAGKINKCVQRTARASAQTCQAFNADRLECLKNFCRRGQIYCRKAKPGDPNASCPSYTKPWDKGTEPTGGIILFPPFEGGFWSDMTGANHDLLNVIHEAAHACGVDHGIYGGGPCECNDIYACCALEVWNGGKGEKCVASMKTFLGKGGKCR